MVLYTSADSLLVFFLTCGMKSLGSKARRTERISMKVMKLKVRLFLRLWEGLPQGHCKISENKIFPPKFSFPLCWVVLGDILGIQLGGSEVGKTFSFNLLENVFVEAITSMYC